MSENINLTINSILSGFEKVSLKDIESKDLLNRQDKKYIFHSSLLPEILNQISINYLVLEIENKKLFNYRTIYYDTGNLEFYLQHHNGKLSRHKVRSRYYYDTNQTWFEVKSKTNKDKTVKKRIMLNDSENDRENEILDFKNSNNNGDARSSFNSAINLLKKHLEIVPEELVPQLVINYTRVSLLHRFLAEKITIDFGLSVFPIVESGNNQNNVFEIDNKNYENTELNNLVIAETKQERLHGLTEFEHAMSKFHIRSTSISKYCTGMVLIKPDIKHNRFKNKFKSIYKIAGIKNGI